MNKRKRMTGNIGAARERECWMRKVRRMLRLEQSEAAKQALEVLLVWGKHRTERTARKTGGLGRK